ncbi:MAG: magnesium transporter [Vicinamibacteria bacterium]|jgi:magnesium transporter|nr:magnesium transporter [Vicinamibacteria bacterium]MBP9945598.1 magnesium transporter [Vicinamibacteria bacterium]
MNQAQSDLPVAEAPSRLGAIAVELVSLAPNQAAEKLDPLPDAEAATVLAMLSPAVAEDIMLAMGDERRQAVIAAAPLADSSQWTANFSYPDGSIGRLMEPPRALFRPEMTVAESTERIRELVKNVFVTYGFVVDAAGVLLGVVAMRDLLLASRDATIDSVMIRKPFTLAPDADAIDAMKVVVTHHFPVYPVCDATGRLVGIVRGRTLFEQQAYEISAQVGSMVGVEKEERLSTPWNTSLKYRHPWLQLNLLTAFVAAGVVGYFQDTIDKLVVLAVFLPVLAGQSGNTGCQALAVTLRGMTLGELKPGRERILVMKEGLLGLLNGALVGVTAGLGMYVVATLQSNPAAAMLGFVVFLAMIGSCVVSGLSGALIPLTLKRLGADPATASSIFLTTATDVASMGLFLSLARFLIL